MRSGKNGYIMYLLRWFEKGRRRGLLLFLIALLMISALSMASGLVILDSGDSVEFLDGLEVDKLTLVLVTICKHTDIIRLGMLAGTLRRFVPGTVSKLFILTSDICLRNPRIFKPFDVDMGFPVEVLSERKLLNISCRHAGERMMAYGKQMLLKLLISYYIETRFYLTLDADILVIKNPIGLQDLIPENRAIWYPNEYWQHIDWWQASFDLLGDDRCRKEFENNEQRLTSVTPFVLSTEIARRTFAKISARWPRGLICYALQNWGPRTSTIPWTEYTAYRIVACQEGLFEKYYHEEGDSNIYFWSQTNKTCINDKCQREQLRNDLITAKSWGRLMMITQDNRYKNPEWLIPVVQDVLNLPKQIDKIRSIKQP